MFFDRVWPWRMQGRPLGPSWGTFGHRPKENTRKSTKQIYRYIRATTKSRSSINGSKLKLGKNPLCDYKQCVCVTDDDTCIYKCTQTEIQEYDTLACASRMEHFVFAFDCNSTSVQQITLNRTQRIHGCFAARSARSPDIFSPLTLS